VHPRTARSVAGDHLPDLTDPHELSLDRLIEHVLKLIIGHQRRDIDQRAGRARDRQSAMDPDVFAIQMMGAMTANARAADRRVRSNEHIDQLPSRPIN
jgi:hypothetical protein